MLLLAEHAPEDGRILVLGAGGGLEMRRFADAMPGWRFDGVDPSGPMLDLARKTLGPHRDRVTLHHGLIDVAPDGPFDGATCILTLHFVDRAERAHTLAELRRRLKPGAPLIVAHFSFPQGDGEGRTWLARYAAFALASGVEPERVEKAASEIPARLSILAPAEDERMLSEAGFSGVTLFYAGLTFRGWVAYA